MRKVKRITLCLLAFSLPSFAVTLDDVNHAHKAIQTQLYSTDPLNTLDINELQLHINMYYHAKKIQKKIKNKNLNWN